MVESLNKFQLLLPRKIIFDAGSIKRLAKEILSFGDNVLLITGKNSLERSENLKKVLVSFEEEKINYHIVKVSGEPTCKLVDGIVSEFKSNMPSVVVSIGGGSVVDVGKAVSAMLTEEGSVADYLEVLGTKSLSGNKIPFIACPTTAGTGSEMTKNAVIKKEEIGESKRSIRHDNLVPDVAVIDPELTLNCPKKVTMQSGLDAFSQLVEAYTCTNANEFTDSLILNAIKRMAKSLILACTDKGNDIQVRKDISYAAMISGIGLANAGLSTVHGFAGVIGGMYDAPHGAVCASLLWAANVVNMQRIKDYDPNNEAAHKYAMLGSILSGIDYDEDKHEVLFRAVSETLEKWREILKIPHLSDFGVTKDDFWKILEKSSQKANPVELTESEMEKILEMSL